MNRFWLRRLRRRRQTVKRAGVPAAATAHGPPAAVHLLGTRANRHQKQHVSTIVSKRWLSRDYPVAAFLTWKPTGKRLAN